jgi:hypothetical protein
MIYGNRKRKGNRMDYEFYEDQKEGILLNLIKDLEDNGISITEDDIFWTGFGSQGNGLVYDFKNMDILKFMDIRVFKYKDTLLYQAIKKDLITITFETVKNNFAAYYNHEKTRNIQGEFDIDESLLKLYDLSYWKDLIKDLNEDISAFRIQTCLDTYKELEDAYSKAERMEAKEYDESDDYYGLDPKDEEEIEPDIYIHYKTQKKYKIIQSKDLQIQENGKWVDAIMYQPLDYHKKFVRSAIEFYGKFTKEKE